MLKDMDRLRAELRAAQIDLDRRSFLKRMIGTGVAAGSALMLPGVARGQLAAPAAPTNVRIGTTAAGTKTLLTAADFEWVGVMTLPFDISQWSFGCLAMRKVNGSLRFFTTDWASGTFPIYEIDCPGFGASLSVAPRATVVKSWGDIYGGRRTVTSATPVAVYTEGLWWDEANQALWWNYGDFYNTTTTDDCCIGFSILGSSGFTAFGPWYTQAGAKKTRDWTLQLPPAFVSAYCPGKELAMGAGLWSGNRYSSWGPGLIAVQRPTTSTPAKSTLASSTLAFYPVQGDPSFPIDPTSLSQTVHRRDTNYMVVGSMGQVPYNGGSYLNVAPIVGKNAQARGWPKNGTTGFWEENDLLNACSWVDLPDKEGVVFFGQQSHGNLWYGTSDAFTNFNDWTDGTGPHCTQRDPRFWIMAPSDLAKVAQGQKNSWDIQASAVVDPLAIRPDAPFGGRANTSECRIVGSVFDPSTRMLYYLAQGAEAATGQGRNVIHCWHIK